jgi:hypothetical protein
MVKLGQRGLGALFGSLRDGEDLVELGHFLSSLMLLLSLLPPWTPCLGGAFRFVGWLRKIPQGIAWKAILKYPQPITPEGVLEYG